MSPQTTQAHAIAAQFAALMAQHFTPETLDAVSDANASEENPHVCHSHDLCDANDLMAQAFQTVTAREIDLQSDADRQLWGEAFTAYRFHGSRVGRALAACGFALRHAGGNQWNWRRDVVTGMDMYCCDIDGREPVDSEPCCFGIGLWASDSLSERQWRTGAELARSLNGRRT